MAVDRSMAVPRGYCEAILNCEARLSRGYRKHGGTERLLRGYCEATARLLQGCAEAMPRVCRGYAEGMPRVCRGYAEAMPEQ